VRDDDGSPDARQGSRSLPEQSRGVAGGCELPLRYLRPAEVARMFGVAPMTIWRWERDGKFPKREEIGPNSVGWPEHVILAWAKNRPVAGPHSANRRGRGRKPGKQKSPTHDQNPAKREEVHLPSNSYSHGEDRP
jgi:prophage regulatory protein